MAALCCDAWMMPPASSTCMVQPDGCLGTQHEIAVMQASNLSECPQDSVLCDVFLYPGPGSCCVWDCRELDACSNGAQWSCCRGFCGELLDPQTGRELGPDPACSTAPRTVSACCTPEQIFLPGASTGASNEWIVRFGYASAPIDASVGIDAQASDESTLLAEPTDPDGATDAPSDDADPRVPNDAASAMPCAMGATGAGCSMTEAPAAAPRGWLFVLGLCLAWARRRRP